MSPREIPEAELAAIASALMLRLEARFGKGRVRSWINSSPDLAHAFVAELYSLLREKLH